jgi:glycosyltransferase involved in cell wall biosynthesis
MIDATIVIPTYNRSKLLRQALQSVALQRVPKGRHVECLVIDNNSTDDTLHVVEGLAASQFPMPLRYVVEKRQGLNHARNAGLRESSGVWTIFLDDDMLVDAGWLEAFFSSHSDVDADLVTGPVDPLFEGPVPNWCGPRLLESVTSSYSQRGNTPRKLVAAERHDIPGCNFAVRTELGRTIGGFHLELDRAGEKMLAGGDTEFAMRVAQANGTAIYVPGCTVQHLVSMKKTSRSGLRARWRGLGATEKRIRELHSLPRNLPKFRARVRSLRYRLRAVWLRVLGDPESFRWRLEAERLDASI